MTKATIVLADDHPAFVEVSSRLVSSEYDVVASVLSGAGALAAVEEHDPDLLVLDLAMPGMSGMQVLEALRRREIRTRVVVLTLHQQRAIADQAFLLGAAGFVTKPRMSRDLCPALLAVLRGEGFCSPLSH